MADGVMDGRGFASVFMPPAPAKTPVVRLSRVNPAHARLIEVMRAVLRRGPTAADIVDSPVFAAELARRGVLDPVDHFSTVGGLIAINTAGLRAVRSCVRLGFELGLVMVKQRGKKTLCRVTAAGMETLKCWDDPEADGMY
jgi:hypothetical protein